MVDRSLRSQSVEPEGPSSQQPPATPLASVPESPAPNTASKRRNGAASGRRQPAAQHRTPTRELIPSSIQEEPSEPAEKPQEPVVEPHQPSIVPSVTPQASGLVAAGQTPVAAAAPCSRAPIAPAPQQVVSLQGAGSSPSSDEDNDSDDASDSDGEEDYSGGLMSKLAASIRAAFKVKAGNSQQSKGQGSKEQQQEPEGGASGQAAAGAEEQELPDAASLRWKPQVELPKQRAPTRAVHDTRLPEAKKEEGLAKQLLAPPRDPKVLAKADRGARPDTAGGSWFDLPAQRIDADMKQELRLLRLRHVYDPKRFYKSMDGGKFPKHFHMGTVVEGATEYYSARLPRAERKRTLTEQLLVDPSITQSRKKRYAKVQEEAQKYQRVKKRKTEQPRRKAPKHKPKH